LLDTATHRRRCSGTRALPIATSRTNTLALPFCYRTLRAQKPKDSRYPPDLRTLGDHLRKRRLDLGLRQRDVGHRIGVDACTIKNWELSHTSPETRHLPAIHEFLGYQPFEPGQSLAENLRFIRRTAGLSQEQFAERTGFDESTIAKWERADKLPLPRNLDRLRAFFRTSGQALPSFETGLSYSSARRAEAARAGHRTRRSKLADQKD
jgi:transcriptional regulator with XRE-family HTH domain